jgi:ATP-dependent DNA helicase HFM1/MER3
VNIQSTNLKNPFKLNNISRIPVQFRSVFPFESFNSIQQQLFEKLLNSDDNVCVEAPTGSGKTVLFEIAMIRLFSSYLLTSDPISVSPVVVYIAPTKALCQEKTVEWKQKFEFLKFSGSNQRKIKFAFLIYRPVFF